MSIKYDRRAGGKSVQPPSRGAHGTDTWWWWCCMYQSHQIAFRTHSVNVSYFLPSVPKPPAWAIECGFRKYFYFNNKLWCNGSLLKILTEINKVKIQSIKTNKASYYMNDTNNPNIL